MTVNEKGLEAAQVAAREGCGLFIESQHVFCDDPVVGEAADGYGKPLRQPYCSCKGDAERIIKAYLRASSNDAEPVAWTSSGNLDGLRDHESLVIGSMCNRQGDGWTVPLYLTAIEPVAASPGVPDGWRYSINYGPDGQEDWANLIAPDGRHVANIRTHHAIAIVAGMNSPSPAPIVPSTRWRTFAEEQPVAISYLARFFDNELGEWVFTTCDPGPLSITLAAPYTHWIPLNELLAPTSPEPSPSTEDVMGEARGALAIALSAIEKAGDDLQASGAYPVGALAALIVPAEQVRTAITNIDRALSSKQRSGE